MDVQELRPGLWRWTAAHPEWHEELHWPQQVGSVYAELPDAVVVIDPQVPDDAPERFWEALDRDVERLGRPVHVLLTVHWHERSVEAVLARYRATLWRPDQPGELPSGVRAEIVEGADWVEALFYLEPWRALVHSFFATVSILYFVLALNFWFRVPAIGFGIAAGCFIVASFFA